MRADVKRLEAYTVTKKALSELANKGFAHKKLTTYCYRLTKNGITVDWWWSTDRWRVQPTGPSGYGLMEAIDGLS